MLLRRPIRRENNTRIDVITVLLAALTRFGTSCYGPR